MQTYTSTHTATQVRLDGAWQVVLLNCYCHFFEEVVLQLQKAIGCSQEVAETFAEIADQTGSVVVFRGPHDACQRVAGVLGSIGLGVEVSRVRE